MEKRTRNAVVTAVTSAVAAGALATGLAATAVAGTVHSAAVASPSGTVSANASATAAKAGKDTASESFSAAGAKSSHGEKSAHEKKKASRSKRSKLNKSVKAVSGLPSGRATATSFWDPSTASGKPMRYATLASPYWPLGTKVQITYNGQSTVGVVEDFGPAEWAVSQHTPPAILDLSEKMMADFTGARENSVTVHFQVLKMGSGSVYRSSGTGYDLAMGN
ncbi:MAG: hypothetical protein JWO67_5140 [Streptosporangiaceae bacterium]|jgi:hypothetical protein|nr:hypothetical protein [Streptosporangiaceae bacterium]